MHPIFSFFFSSLTSTHWNHIYFEGVKEEWHPSRNAPGARSETKPLVVEVGQPTSAGFHWDNFNWYTAGDGWYWISRYHQYQISIPWILLYQYSKSIININIQNIQMIDTAVHTAFNWFAESGQFLLFLKCPSLVAGWLWWAALCVLGAQGNQGKLREAPIYWVVQLLNSSVWSFNAQTDPPIIPNHPRKHGKLTVVTGKLLGLPCFNQLTSSDFCQNAPRGDDPWILNPEGSNDQPVIHL